MERTARRTTRSSFPGLALAALCAWLVLALDARAQAPGLLIGVVLDDLSARPVVGASISVIGHDLRATSDGTGRFELERVPIGDVQLRFEADGYMSVREEVGLTEANFLQVRLSPVQAALDEVLVVAGRRPRSSNEVRVAEQESFHSVLDLIEEQVPGVSVNRGGALGGGAYLFLRGISSFQLDLAPEVYLDGIRLDGRNTGSTSLHVLDMIPGSAVARVRVLKAGTAEAASFPSGAPNGVVVIETHGGWRGGGR